MILSLFLKLWWLWSGIIIFFTLAYLSERYQYKLEKWLGCE